MHAAPHGQTPAELVDGKYVSPNGILVLKHLDAGHASIDLSVATESGCEGEFSGPALIAQSSDGLKNLTIRAPKCALDLRVSGSSITVDEKDCDGLHGMQCGFSNTYKLTTEKGGTQGIASESPTPPQQRSKTSNADDDGFDCSALSGGCDDPGIVAVREGTMANYDATTVGAAFDASFSEPRWKAFVADKGQHVVEFRGRISKKLHADFIEATFRGHFDSAEEKKLSDTMWATGTPVYVQWVILKGGATFRLQALKSDAWDRLDAQHILDVIYR